MKEFMAAIFLVSLGAIGACHTRTSIGQLDAGFSTGGHSVLPGTGGNPSEGTGGNPVPHIPTTASGGAQATGGYPQTGGTTASGGAQATVGSGPGPGDGQACLGTGGGAGGQGGNVPSFRPAVTYPVRGGPRSVALGDLNGDKVPDLAVITYRRSDPPNTGGATFGGPGTGGAANTGGAYQSSFWDASLNILLNAGDGTLGSPTIYPAGSPTAVAIGDLNGDGRGDLAIASAVGSLIVRLNDGKGAFGDPVEYSVGVGPSAVALADIDGDGKLDIAVANIGGTGLDTRPGDVGVLYNAGNGTFTSVNYPAGSKPSAIALGDLTGNGKPSDFVVANQGGGVGVLIAAQEFKSYAPGSVPNAVAIGDLNGDGKPDIAASDVGFGSSGGVAVLLNGGGVFGAAIIYGTHMGTGSVAIGDLNVDGFPDLAFTNTNDGCGSMGFLLNKGNGTFSAPMVLGTGALAGLGDVNGDGKTDVVALQDNGVSVLLNAR